MPRFFATKGAALFVQASREQKRVAGQETFLGDTLLEMLGTPAGFQEFIHVIFCSITHGRLASAVM
jgi:hypothetical protein